ncbi:NAD(P)-binding protein [Hypomontagnella submonticulosa]|nr:NAD(P)-binding protein [Hypomontagnella submonticulosa]
MSNTIKVAVVGATGNTGKSVVDGLLAETETKYEITALTRPTSVNNEANKVLQGRGVHVVAADLTGPKEDLVKLLSGIDVVISCIVFSALKDQIPLAEAAKEAGVKRFVPCDFATPAPRGVMALHDQKDDVLAAIQRIYLPYTIIDIGWWSGQSVPELPSGRTKHAVGVFNVTPGDGNVPIAYTDLPDIGKYVAKIVADPRTLNKKVFAYTEVLSTKQVDALMEELSGETPIRNHLNANEVLEAEEAAIATLAENPTDSSALLSLGMHQYIYSWGFRGDNTPESAAYLGYLNFKELYPGVVGKSMRTIFQEILEGK